LLMVTCKGITCTPRDLTKSFGKSHVLSVIIFTFFKPFSHPTSYF